MGFWLLVVNDWIGQLDELKTGLNDWIERLNNWAERLDCGMWVARRAELTRLIGLWAARRADLRKTIGLWAARRAELTKLIGLTCCGLVAECSEHSRVVGLSTSRRSTTVESMTVGSTMVGLRRVRQTREDMTGGRHQC